MDARGDTVAVRLADIPRRVDQVATLGAEEGAALALTLAHLDSRANFFGLGPHPPPDTDEDEVFDIRQAHGDAAAGIAAEVSPWSVIIRIDEVDDEADP